MEEIELIQKTLEKLLGKPVPLTSNNKINKRFIPKKYRGLVDDYYSNKSKSKEQNIKDQLQELFDKLSKS